MADTKLPQAPKYNGHSFNDCEERSQCPQHGREAPGEWTDDDEAPEASTASMKSSMDTLAKMRRVARRLEKTNPKLSLRVSQLAREVRGAKTTDIKIDSWDDFAAWWNTNRSQGLLFTLVDSLGEGNPVIKQMQDVMTQQDALERSLHEIYLQLKSGGKAPAPAAAPEAPGGLEATEEPLPAVEAPAEEPLSDLTEEVTEGV